MTFPLAQAIDHLAYRGQERNSRGNLVDVWADPVPVRVYGWYIASAEEPQVAGHERVRVDAVVLAPEEFRPGPQDRVVLPAYGEYEVVAQAEDYNHGPFGWRPGNSISLRQVTG